MIQAPGAVADPREGQADLELLFPPRPEYVRMARHTVAALARLHDLPDEVVEDVKLAVSEACTNAVTVNAADGRAVRVVATVADDGLVIEVFDSGPGIDPSLIERDPELDSEEFTFERGLSLPLIRGLVDELQILPNEDRGTIVRMRLAAIPEVATANGLPEGPDAPVSGGTGGGPGAGPGP
jgi:serine/threonine-protein kinase RsbW